MVNVNSDLDCETIIRHPDSCSDVYESAQRQVLGNPYLLQMIFTFVCVEEGRQETMVRRLSDRNGKNLVMASLTCKTFFDPAMNVLWKRMDSWEILLKLIPTLEGDEDEYETNGVLFDEHLKNLDLYARRIRHLRVEDVPFVPHHVYVTISKLRRAGLFPTLRTFILCFAENVVENLLGVSLLIPSPTLTRVELCCISSSTEEFAASLLHAISLETRRLEKLVLLGELTSISLDIAIKFIELEELNINLENSHISSDFLEELSGIRHLKTLSLTLDETTVTLDYDFPTSTFTRSSPTIAAFNTLQNLNLCASPDTVLTLLESIYASQLKTITISLAKEASQDDGALTLEKCIRRITQMAQSLQSIQIHSYGQARLPSQALNLLDSCKHLVRVNIHVDDLIDTTPRTFYSRFEGDMLVWRSLQVLKLVGKRGSTAETLLSLVSMHQFIPSCPNLKELTISVVILKDLDDIRKMQADIKTRRRPCHKLQELELISLDSDPPTPQTSDTPYIRDPLIKDAVTVSRYIDHLFPHLKEIILKDYGGKFNQNLCQGIEFMVKELQDARNSEKGHICVVDHS